MAAHESWYATRTLRALELLAFAPCSAPELARSLQVHPRTARRLLSRLVAEEYLTCSEGDRRVYAPTLRIVALAGQIVARSELALVARRHVEQLHEQTGVAAQLALPSYRSVLCLIRANSGQPAESVLHELAPCHCTATGKALLTYREPWRQSALSRSLERLTDRTLVEPVALERETARIRERGFAIEDREHLPDTRGVAAPVFDRSGEAVAALGITGSGDTLPTEQLLLHAMRVREAACRLSEALAQGDRQLGYDAA